MDLPSFVKNPSSPTNSPNAAMRRKGLETILQDLPINPYPVDDILRNDPAFQRTQIDLINFYGGVIEKDKLEQLTYHTRIAPTIVSRLLLGILKDAREIREEQQNVLFLRRLAVDLFKLRLKPPAPQAMEQSKALNALEPYLALSKAANSPRAAADVIIQATSAQNTYVFAELLHTPNILKLEESEQKEYLELLKIFCWGNWQDYIEKKASLPTLNEAQTKKLKLLSIISYSKSHDNLTYPSLQKNLEVETSRELETLVTDSIYAGLVAGTMDPQNQRVLVTSVAPMRDLAPGSIPTMVDTLEVWKKNLEGTIDDLEAQAEQIKANARAREERRTQREAASKAAMEKEDAKANKKGDGDADEDIMDVDDEGSLKKGLRNAKRNLGLGKRL